MLDGKHLITIENLRGPGGELHPVQQALVAEHGSQCGYCTPGIVMSLFALFKRRFPPTEEEIQDALVGNLCRCTGYAPIIRAAAGVCKGDGRDHFTEDEPRINRLLRSVLRDSVSIKTPLQRYDQPASLREALELLASYPDSVVISGASDVALRVTKGYEVLPHIIDCSKVEELKSVSRQQNALVIGAGLPLNEMASVIRDEFPVLRGMLDVFAAHQIRNVATLGGNLATASPVGDALPVLMALGAEIVLQSASGTRQARADDFVTGYRKTVRRPDELITSVILPKPATASRMKAYKISRRRDLDIATVSAGFRVDLSSRGLVEDVVLAYGGMAERTKRAARAEAFLRGKPWKRDVVEEAGAVIQSDFTPISDVRGSAEMRRIAARNLLLKFWHDTNR